MARSLNKATILGNLTRDPEIRTTATGLTVASFSVATNFSWRNAQGEIQELPEFHNVVAWRRLAEVIGQYLRKGSQVYIEGRLQTRSWDDPSGVKKYRTEIVVDQLIMLGGRPAQESGASFSQNKDASRAQVTQQTPKQDIPTIDYSAPVPETPATTLDENIDEDEVRVEDIPF